MAHLSVRTLGPFQVLLDDEPVTGFDSDKVRSLLAYLVVEADHPHRREKLAGLLWPDFPDQSARTSLRSALANLRKAIGDQEADPKLHDEDLTRENARQSSLPAVVVVVKSIIIPATGERL